MIPKVDCIAVWANSLFRITCRVLAALEIDHDPHPVAVGLVAQVPTIPLSFFSTEPAIRSISLFC
jgi:hypothetical protein